MPQTTICEEVMKKGIYNIIEDLADVLDKDLWKELNSNVKENILKELEKARLYNEFGVCFMVIDYLIGNFGITTAEWTGKFCRLIQTIAMTKMKDNPAFNLLKFYDWLFKTKQVHGSDEEDNYDGTEDCCTISDGYFDPSGMGIDDVLSDEEVRRVRDVLVTSMIEESDLKLRCGKEIDWSNYSIDHYWKLIEFGHTHANKNLIDLCELKIAFTSLDQLGYSYGNEYGTYHCEKVIEQINRASKSPKYKNLQHLNISVLIQRHEKYPPDRTQEYFDTWQQLKEEALDEIHTVYKMMREVAMEEEELLRAVNKCKENLNSS